MIPINALLDRIRWDDEFGRGVFALGYYDRVEELTLIVPFEKIHFPGDGHFFFEAEGPDGEIVSIPLHRVRQVYKNGELIWNRETPHPDAPR